MTEKVTEKITEKNNTTEPESDGTREIIDEPQSLWQTALAETIKRRDILDSELDRMAEIIESLALPVRYLLRLFLFLLTTCVALLAAGALRMQGRSHAAHNQKESDAGGLALAKLLILPRETVKDALFFSLAVAEILGARLIRPGELRYLSKAPRLIFREAAYLLWRSLSQVAKVAHLLPHIVPRPLVRAIIKLAILIVGAFLLALSSFISDVISRLAALIEFEWIATSLTIWSNITILIAFGILSYSIWQALCVLRQITLFILEVTKEVTSASVPSDT